MNIYYTDCFVLGTNPSDKGGGYTITDHIGKIIHKETIYKKGFTNNEGEVLGIIKAIELCEPTSEIYSDSSCAIAWIRKGKSKVRSDLNEILSKGKEMAREKKCEVIWISREENLAGLVNEGKL